jgi:cobalamin transport system substrate-binding protein
MRIWKKLPRFTLHASRFTFSILILLSIPTQALAFSRIISLKPNVTEILFALGAGSKVVGVTTYCTRPPEAQKLPKVADYIQAYPEPILRLEPDLIIGSEENSSQKEVYFLMDRGIPVKLFRFSTIPETIQSIEAIGVLLGRGDIAHQITQKMKAELEGIKKEASQLPKRKILFVVGYEPLVVAGGNNFFDEATDYLAAVNVAHESRLKYPTYTTELLIRAAPDIILDMAMGSENSEAKQRLRKDWWKQFPSIPAVQNNQIYNFDIEKMRAVPSLPSALQEIFDLIHPKTH